MKLLLQRWWLTRRRRRWRRVDALETLYRSSGVSLKRPLAKQKFVVIDCEMTGLDGENDHLVEIGWVCIESGAIRYGSRVNYRVYSKQQMGDSAKIHGILNAEVAGSKTPSTPLIQLVQELDGAIAVFHHASLDVKFLQRAAQQFLGEKLLFPVVDTLQVEQLRQRRSNEHYPVQLTALAHRYGLPVASAHNAMSDALMTAQLFLAQFEGFRGQYRKVSDLPNLRYV